METTEQPEHHFGGIYNYFQGATIHNIVINGNMSKSGNEYYQKENTTTNGHTYTDEQIAQALTNIVGKGKPIDSKQKWAGALWLLRWECNYPLNTKLACERIMRLPFTQELEYSCDYNNVRPMATLSFLNEDPHHMESVKYSKNDEQAFLQMRGVAIALNEELQKTHYTE